MKKSILSILVTLSMLLSLLPTAFADADNTNAAFELVPDTATVAQGENITFSFNVKNLELVDAIGAKLSYDPSKLVYVSSERGNIYSYDYTENTGKILNYDAKKNAVKANLAFKENHDVSSDTYFKVTFMAAADLEPGKYSDYITVDEASAFRGLTEFKLDGSVPEIEVVKGSNATPLLVQADNTTISMGETVTYTISAMDEIELDGLELDLTYDKSLLRFEGGTLPEGTTSELTEDKLVWANSDAVKFDGEIATLTFTAIANGTAVITADAASAPTLVKAVFPKVNIASQVSITVTSDKENAASGDVVTYTVSLDEDASIQALQLSLDFSDIDVKDAKAALGSSLEGVEAIANDTAFNNGIFTVAFANDALTEIKAGTLATLTFTLASDIAKSYAPAVEDSSAQVGDTTFTADVKVDEVVPTPVTAQLSAQPDSVAVQAGDTVTYTVSIDRLIAPTAFETHFDIDEAFVDGDITVKAVSENVDVNYNKVENDVTAVAFNMGEPVELSGDLFTVSFKTKADENVVLTPVFSDITAVNASIDGVAAPVSILAQSAAAVTVNSTPEFALPGSTVVYTVDLNASALKILDFTMSYDPAIYTEAKLSTADATPLTVETKVDKEAGSITALFMGEKALNGDIPEFITVEFNVADEPKTGDDGVTYEFKSDEFTTVDVKDNADTKIVSSNGRLAVNTDKTYVMTQPNAEFVTVTVSLEKISELTDLSLELNYDKSVFSSMNVKVNEGAEWNKIEEGRIRYVYTGDAIEGENVDIITLTLFPYELATGTWTKIEAVEVATTSNLDTVKASKSVYAFSRAESAAITQIRDAINAIGDVTKDNYTDKEAVVANARALYDTLATDEIKAKLADETKKLTDAENAVKTFKDAAAKAAAVDALIDAIGDVTADSEAAIKTARDAFDALDDTAKYFVKNYDKLTAAEAALADIKAAAAADALIDAIGDVTDASGDAIKAARDAYDALSDNAKTYVKNLDKLTAAEAAYAKIVEDKAAAAAVDELIDAIGDVTADNFLDKADAIKAAEDAYAALTDDQKAYVTGKDDLDAARAAYDSLYEAMKSLKVVVSKNADNYSVAITKQKETEADPVVYVAVYDKATNKLITVSSAKVSEGAPLPITADTANTTAKAFVWTDKASQTPFEDVEIVY